MINRVFPERAGSPFSFTGRNFARPFDFATKEQLAFAIELERQLLELEQRFANKACADPIPQQRMGGDCEPCTYDDFGLVEGLELDVSWM